MKNVVENDIQSDPPLLVANEVNTRRQNKAPVLVVLNGCLLLVIQIIPVFVIPVFAAMFSDFGAELPLPTRLLLDYSYYIIP